MPPEKLPQFPKDTIPGALGSWWQRADDRQLRRGRLIWAFVPYVNLVPKTLEAQGRSSATDHTRALFKLVPTQVRRSAGAPRIPVAALPLRQGESYSVYRAKVRPLLVVSVGGMDLPPELRRRIGSQGDPCILGAPYAGVDQTGKRGGWPPEFVRRISRGEYPQYAYDRLPLGGPVESILRLDHLQPIGRHHDSYELTDYRVTDEALLIIDEWLEWLVTGELDPESMLAYFRGEIPKVFPEDQGGMLPDDPAQ